MFLTALMPVVPDLASGTVAAACGLLAWRWRRASRLAVRRAAELRAAHEASERHAAFLAAVLDEMPDRIVITDARGEVLLLNDAVRSDHGGAALTGDAPVEQMGLYE